METLYQLTTALRTAIDGGYTFDADTGEIIWSPDQLDELDVAMRDKAEACAVVLKEKRAFAQSVKDEIEELEKRYKTLRKQAERMENYMLDCVELNGGAIETPKCRISARRAQALEILDESKVPAEYMRTKITKNPDKIAIKSALKAGEYVPGCALVENKHLQVR